jgi:hypothetical protein
MTQNTSHIHTIRPSHLREIRKLPISSIQKKKLSAIDNRSRKKPKFPKKLHADNIRVKNRSSNNWINAGNLKRGVKTRKRFFKKGRLPLGFQVSIRRNTFTRIFQSMIFLLKKKPPRNYKLSLNRTERRVGCRSYRTVGKFEANWLRTMRSAEQLRGCLHAGKDEIYV